MDCSYALARNVVDTKYEDLPVEVVEVTKNSILDTIGVILAGSTLGEEGLKGIIELVKQGGGKKESTIIGFGDKVVSWMAAFANGAMAHQLDYDDTYDVGPVHPGAATIPAGCAIAERQGNVTGKEFITAIALGCDVVCRLALARTRSSKESPWGLIGVVGKFGAAATAGKLLRLDETQMVNAFGLVLNQVSITRQSSYAVGSSIRAIRDAFVANAGVLSALLAEKGIMGDKDCLEGKHGLYNSYWPGGYDSAKVTANLGKRFEGVDVSFKAWPCCRAKHSAIEATLNLVREHDIRPEHVKQITLVRGVPFESGVATLIPKTGITSIDARYNFPFCLGVAIARRGVSLEDFTPEGLSNSIVLDLAQKVTFRFEEPEDRMGIEIGKVEIKTKDGGNYSSELVRFPHGRPESTITNKDLVAKFRDCARYSVNSLSPERIDEIIQTLGSLEEVADVSQVIQLLA